MNQDTTVIGRAVVCTWVRIFTLLLLCLWMGCDGRSRELPDPGQIATLESGWLYRFGASPSTADGGLLWAQPAAADLGFKATPRLIDPPNRDGNNELWLRTNLQGPALKQPTLYFGSVDISYEAYVDGKLVFQFGNVNLPEARHIVGSPRALIPLPVEYQGKTFAIRIYSPYRSIGAYGPVLVGEHAALLRREVNDGLPLLIVGFLLVAIAVASGLLFLMRRNERAYLYYFGFTLFTGIYHIARSHTRSFVFDVNAVWWSSELISLCLLAACLCAFFAVIFGRGPFGLMSKLAKSFVIYFFAGLFLTVSGLINMSALLLPLQLLLLLAFATIFWVAVTAAIRGTADGKILGGGILLAMVPALLDLLASMDVLPIKILLSHYSAALFVLALGIVLARRFVDVYQRLSDYSTVLQLSLSSARGLDPTEHTQVALEQVLKICGGERALLFLLPIGSDSLELSVGRDAQGNAISSARDFDPSLIATVRNTRQAFLGARVSSEGKRPLSLVAAPLLLREQLLGVLYLEVDEEKHHFGDRDSEILMGLCSQLALSLMTTRALRLEFESALQGRRLEEQRALLLAAGQLARGDLSSPIEVPPQSDLAPLARALDEMRRDLQIKIQQLEFSNQEVNQLNEELRRQIEQRSRKLMDIARRSDESRRPRRTSFAPGKMLAEHYRIVRILGQGATGTVYEVERTTDSRHLAAKVLAAAADKSTMLRFAREAQILARLRHPNLISIVDVDVTEAGVLYLVMELVRGLTLKLSADRFGDPRFGLPVLLQIADGLVAIHESGIVHRDLKPANVLIADGAVDGPPLVKLVDFGISTLATGGLESAAGTSQNAPLQKLLAPARDAAQAASAVPSEIPQSDSLANELGDDGSEHLTQAGVLVGTPMYMAPELQQGSRSARAAADLFSLGVIAYELLTGALPFREPPVVTLSRGETVHVPSLLSVRGDLPRPVVVILDRCLKLDPAARPTAKEVSEALSHYAARAGAGQSRH